MSTSQKKFRSPKNKNRPALQVFLKLKNSDVLRTKTEQHYKYFAEKSEVLKTKTDQH